MRNRARVSAVCAAVSLYAAMTLAEEPLPEMSFLEFLGSAIERNGELLDPLTLHDDETLEAEPADPAAPAAAEAISNAAVNEKSPLEEDQ